jgi:hypothetical protein
MLKRTHPLAMSRGLTPLAAPRMLRGAQLDMASRDVSYL